VDDPEFEIGYHVRRSALPRPGDHHQLRELVARIASRPLDRSRPLWEIYFVEGLEGGRVAVLTKSHQILVDGRETVDIGQVLLDTTPEAPDLGHDEWQPRRRPTALGLAVGALTETLERPGTAVRTVQANAESAARTLSAAAHRVGGVAGALAGRSTVHGSPINRPLSQQRRFLAVRTELEDYKRIRSVHGGTVNDVVLATVAGALGKHLRRRGMNTDGVELKAMVPVSVRSDVERGALGNRVAAMMAPLPVWCQDPVARLDIVRQELRGLKSGGQAVGAQVLTELSAFAPPTIMDQAARLSARQRLFNLVVTNVPGPQFPLYLLGRRMLETFPMVPLAKNQALGVALLSYDGSINFGLVGDYDRLWDLDELARDVRESLEELAAGAGVELQSAGERVSA
jgi:diacylglycerol O-acyltransferase / wax synthase